MATVCGGSLSLMDAGVPIKSPVAGISTGLIHENDRYILLTDIQGMEDHLGDMDFKVAGTRKGVTAIQLDLKIKGLPLDVVKETLGVAEKTRLYILDVMDKALPEPRKELSKYAPKVSAIWIPREKIGAVIGPGGKVIRNLQETTNTKIDIEDTTGKVMIAGDTREHVEEARRMIEELVQEVEVGKIYTGKVVKTTTFGAFVEILPGKEGLVHISELALERVRNVEDVVKVGDKIAVKVIGIDEQGKIRLSRKALLRGSSTKVVKINHKKK
jgi:polyribonucleotide nucleotidyltransferase